ncbi:hypothetical protein [Streptomyces mirabilis]
MALTERQFHYAFANTVSAEQGTRERATWAIPGPGRPPFQASLANLTPKARAATYVDYRNDSRSPLLLAAGTAERRTRKPPPPPAL